MGFVVMVVGLMASLFAPILDFMMAILILLTVNLLLGVASAWGGGERPCSNARVYFYSPSMIPTFA